MKLMQNYFFSFWKEPAREGIKATGTPIVDCEQLYFKLSATGHAEQSVRDIDTQELEGGLLSAFDDNVSQGPAMSQSGSKSATKHPFYLVLYEPLSLEVTHSTDMLAQT